jgi:hypothetical protein
MLFKVSVTISKTSFCPFWCVSSEVSMFLWISSANDLFNYVFQLLQTSGLFEYIFVWEIIIEISRVREVLSSKRSSKSPKNSWSEAVVFAVLVVVLSVWYKQTLPASSTEKWIRSDDSFSCRIRYLCSEILLPFGVLLSYSVPPFQGTHCWMLCERTFDNEYALSS